MLQCSQGVIPTSAPLDWFTEVYCYRYANVPAGNGMTQAVHRGIHAYVSSKTEPDRLQKYGIAAFCRFGKVGNPCTGVLGPMCNTKTHAQGLMTGHYTATIWDRSREVGCAYVVCKRQCEGKRNMILVGCQYLPCKFLRHRVHVAILTVTNSLVGSCTELQKLANSNLLTYVLKSL